jgi:NAD(P)-dependent dehydrogenase (short-subunit alcohol dehydrogenase family)
MIIAMTQPTVQRFALVTGGGSGLGRVFCLRLAREGWHVACADIDQPGADETLAQIVASGGRGQVELLDVTEASAWTALRDRLPREWPRLDLLVNNAGVCAAGEIGEGPLEDLDSVLNVNLRGTLLGCHTMTPWLKQTAPGGHIVNIASIAGVLSLPSMGAYNVSKAGVVSLSETLYGELRPHGVGVTVVLPGFFASELVSRGRFAAERHRRLAQAYTRKAQITAEEVVECTLRAVERGKLYVVVGRRARWLWRLKRLTGTTLLGVMSKTYRRRMQKHDTDD